MGLFVNALTVLKDRNEKFSYVIVGNYLLFPGFDRVKEGERLTFVKHLVINAKQVGYCKLYALTRPSKRGIGAR